MNLAFKFLYLTLVLLFFVSCNKSSSDSPANTTTTTTTNNTSVNNGTVTTPAGSYTIAGTLKIYSSCNATTATISIANYTGYSAGAVIKSSQVNNDGTFDFPVPTGSYVISASAGNCSVSAVGQSLTNGQTAYKVCLSTGNECPRSGKATNLTLAGTIDVPATGNGEIKIEAAQIYLRSSKATSVNLSLQFVSGSNLLNSTPSIAKGWNGTLDASGNLELASLKYDHLSYSAQADSSAFKFDQGGVCASKLIVISKSAEYMQQLGFSEKSIADFKAQLSAANTSDEICVYPQIENIDKIVRYLSVDKIVANKVWFLVFNESQVASLQNNKNHPLSKVISRPKSNDLIANKKMDTKRKIASDSDILAEEWALGFLLEK